MVYILIPIHIPININCALTCNYTATTMLNAPKPYDGDFEIDAFHSEFIFVNIKGISCVFEIKIILWMKMIHYPNKIRSQLIISCVFEIKIILWMKTIHYPNKIRSRLVIIVPMALFTLNLNFKVEICSAL